MSQPASASWVNRITQQNRTHLFIGAFLLVAGSSVWTLSRGEFQKRAVSRYQSDQFDWEPEILWSRARIVAVSDASEPGGAVKAFELGITGSTRVGALMGIPTEQILTLSDSPAGDQTAVVYWAGSQMMLGLWKSNGQQVPTFPRKLPLTEPDSLKIAWDSKGKRVFLFWNAPSEPSLLICPTDRSEVVSRRVALPKGIAWCWGESNRPAYFEGNLFACAGRRGTPASALYEIPVGDESDGQALIPRRIGESVSKDGRTLCPSVAACDRVVFSGALPGDGSKTPYADLWITDEPGKQPRRPFKTDDVWGATVGNRRLPHLVFLVHTMNGGGDIWAVRPDSPTPRQITFHAKVHGTPLVTAGPTLTYLTHVRKSGGLYELRMLVFKTEEFQKLYRGLGNDSKAGN